MPQGYVGWNQLISSCASHDEGLQTPSGLFIPHDSGWRNKDTSSGTSIVFAQASRQTNRWIRHATCATSLFTTRMLTDENPTYNGHVLRVKRFDVANQRSPNRQAHTERGEEIHCCCSYYCCPTLAPKQAHSQAYLDTRSTSLTRTICGCHTTVILQRKISSKLPFRIPVTKKILSEVARPPHTWQC